MTEEVLTNEQLIKKLEEDPIYFIEVFLRRNLSPKQVIFIEATKTSRHCVAIWSRQTGKSTVIASYILWRLLYGKGKEINGEHIEEHIIILAPILEQVTNLYDKIESLISKNEYVSKFIIKMNQSAIVAKNGNHISFKSASPGSQIRGSTATCIVIDETQDITDNKYYADILPFGATTDALIIEAGTPKTKNHFFTTMNSPSVVVVKQMWFECPFLSKDYVMDAKHNSPDALWRQEYLCEFIETGVLVFPSDLFIDGKTLENYEYIKDARELNETQKDRIRDAQEAGAIFNAGLDLGRQNDNTVFVVVRADVRPAKIEACITFPLGTQFVEIAKQIAFLYRIYRWNEFNLDYTNEKSFVEILKENDVSVVVNGENKRGAINFTTKVKTEMVNNAKVLLEQFQLCLPSSHEKMLQQFMNQQFEVNEAGKYKYYHPSNEHDDILWATLLALKNVRIADRDEKVQFVNPWERFNEDVHGTQKDVVVVDTLQARKESRKTRGFFDGRNYSSGPRSLSGRP